MSHFEKEFSIFIRTFQKLEFSSLKHPKLYMIFSSKLAHNIRNFQTLFYVITDDIALTVIGQFFRLFSREQSQANCRNGKFRAPFLRK